MEKWPVFDALDEGQMALALVVVVVEATLGL